MDQSIVTRNQQKQKGKPRVSWRNENVMRTFLEVCIREVTENGRQGGSLRSSSWDMVIEVLRETHNFVVDSKQARNRYDYLKYKYQAWCRLKNKTGNVYDSSTNMFNLSEEEWAQEIKINPKAESLKTAPLLFPDLCIQLYDGVAATGINGWGPTSTKARDVVVPNNELELHEIVDIPFNMQGQGSFNPSQCSSASGTQSRASAPSFEDETPKAQGGKDTPNAEGQRPKKRSRHSSKQSSNTQLEEKMLSALELIVQKNSGATIKECKDKLKLLGWGVENPLYKLALGIFCESASYREAWMNLDDDENEQWVMMMSRKLGLLA